jgi:hypothetical protein
MVERGLGKQVSGVETTQTECEVIVFAEDRTSMPAKHGAPLTDERVTERGTRKRRGMMNKKWMILGAVALLFTAGCKKSENTTNQPATSTPSAAPDANSAAPGAASPQAPANAMTAANSAPGAAAPGAAAGTAMTPAAPPPPPPPYEIVAGTSLPVILATKLNSKVNKPGEAVLAIKLTSISVRGKLIPITSSTYGATVKGKGKRTAVVTGGGAAVGALIGGLAGGGKGAAIGAGVGGGGGLAASGATGGENVTLAAESRVTFKLTTPITVDHPEVTETPAPAPTAAPAQ